MYYYQVERFWSWVSFAFLILFFMYVHAKHMQDMQDVRQKMISGHIAAVEARMEHLKGLSFCAQLNGYSSIDASARDQHNAVVEVYNKVLQERGIDRSPELPLRGSSVSVAAINGLIFQAHIDPWLECAQKYSLYRRI